MLLGVFPSSPREDVEDHIHVLSTSNSGSFICTICTKYAPYVIPQAPHFQHGESCGKADRMSSISWVMVWTSLLFLFETQQVACFGTKFGWGGQGSDFWFKFPSWSSAQHWLPSATPNGTVFRKQSAKLLVSVFRAAKFQPKLKKSCLTLKSHGEEFPTSQICVTNLTDFFYYKSRHVHVEICKIKKRDRRKQNSYFVYLST